MPDKCCSSAIAVTDIRINILSALSWQEAEIMLPVTVINFASQ